MGRKPDSDTSLETWRNLVSAKARRIKENIIDRMSTTLFENGCRLCFCGQHNKRINLLRFIFKFALTLTCKAGSWRTGESRGEWWPQQHCRIDITHACNPNNAMDGVDGAAVTTTSEGNLWKVQNVPRPHDDTFRLCTVEWNGDRVLVTCNQSSSECVSREGGQQAGNAASCDAPCWSYGLISKPKLHSRTKSQA